MKIYGMLSCVPNAFHVLWILWNFFGVTKRITFWQKLRTQDNIYIMQIQWWGTKIEKYIYPTYLDAETRPNRARAVVQRVLTKSLAFQAEGGRDCGAGGEGFRIRVHVGLGRFSKSPP